MPDNRLTLTIEAQNLAQAAFKQLQADVRQSNEALKKTDQTARQSSGGIKVYRDELGRFHDAVTGRYVSASRLLREGFTEVERGAGGAADAIKRANPVIARMRQEYNLLRTDIHNTAAVSRQFAGAIQAQIRVQVNAAANLERLRVGLVSITGSIAAATEQYKDLVDVSRLPGINIENSLRATLQLEALGKRGKESTEIIREFGNALALSGTPPRELNQVINAIRQMSGEGKILQEDIAILTTRLAVLVPILKEAFGGTRAEDVREFFDALGVDESEQADRFLRIVLDRLQELPRAGETAANAIENLGDTTQRVQASIGANFLPLVKETTGALEAFLMQVERDEGLARNIAVVEAFGASWLGVTAALTGVAAAIPAVSAAVSFLFTGPAAIAVGVVATLTAGLVAWKIASQEVESEVDRLNSTIDQNRRALISYQEAVTSGQLGDIQSAQRGIQAQRQAILRNIEGLIAERHRVQEQRDQLQSQINFQEFQGVDPSQARQDRLSGLNAQIQNLNKSIEAANFEFLELGQSGRHLNELGKPLVDANVNTEKLTKSITDLKSELEEEVAFEDVSRGLLGNETDFRKSAIALADIQALIRLNAATFEELGTAASSGNQEAVKGLAAVNKELSALRDTAADQHIDNLSTAFEKLTNTTDPSRKQLEQILKSAEAFAVTFQGGADVLQDDVARALGLISQVRQQLQAVSEDELRLEVHDEGAQSLTEALLRFHDLQRTVQEDAGLDAQRSAEKQATAYIRAYRDTIDPAILHLVESVKTLRAEVRGTIQDLEALNLQDQLRLDLNAENLSPAADFFTELVDLQQAAQGDLTRSQIENLEKRSQALKQQISEDTFNFAAYGDEIAAIDETLTDKSLSLLADTVDARQAQYENDLLAQRQAEDQKQKKFAETHEFSTYLLGLPRDSLKAATQEFNRLEERALDASSQRQRENLIRETQQFVDAYAERGEAFRDLVTDAQDLGVELQNAFDLTEQQKRLEDFRDALAGVIADLAGLAIDSLADRLFSAGDDRGVFRFVEDLEDAINSAAGITGVRIAALQDQLASLQATDPFADFDLPDVSGFAFDENAPRRLEDAFADIEVSSENLASAIAAITESIRYERLEQDQLRRRSRLEEDAAARVESLERRRQLIASRRRTGDQRSTERNIQQQQDLSFQIAEARRQARTRLTRFDEDAEIRRIRFIEDALNRAFGRQQQRVSLPQQLLSSVGDTISNSVSNAIGGAISNLAINALSNPIKNLGDSIKNLFGDGGDAGDTDSDGTTDAQGEADVDGTITTLTLDPNAAKPDVTGLKGTISTLALDPAAVKPDVTGLKGIISTLALDPLAIKPDVTGLKGIISELALSDTVVKPASIDLSDVPVTLPDADLDVDTPETFDLSTVPLTLPDEDLAVDTPETFDLSTIPVTLPDADLDVDTPKTFDLSGVPVTLPESDLAVDTPETFNLSTVPVTLPNADLDVDTPETFNLSGVPVTLPNAVLDVDTPETVDLSSLQYTNIPNAEITITDPELLDPIDFGGLRYTNIPEVQIPINIQIDPIDLSGLQYQNIPQVDIPINTTFNPIDLSGLQYQNIPNVDIPVTDPAQLDPVDLSDLEYENVPEVPLELPDTDLLDPIDLGGLRFSNAPEIPLGIPDTIDLSGAEVVLPTGLQELLDGIGRGGGEGQGEGTKGGDGSGNDRSRGEEDGEGAGQQGSQHPALFEDRERRHRLFRPPPQESDVTHAQLTEGLINRQRTGGNPLSLNRILDGFNRLIEAGLSGLPDFLEPIVREVAAQGVGVSTDGDTTYLTTADGRRLATLSQDEDSGATTIAALPETVTGGQTTGTEKDTEQTTTTVRIGGGDPGRAGINLPLIDPTDYLEGLEGAVAGQLTPEALSDAVESAILNPNQPAVFEATISPNQIVITPQTPEFDPTAPSEPLIPTFQRPTLTRRPPEASVVEVDYGTLFSGATGDFTGGEGALDRLVYFLSGLELPDQPAPAPQDDDNVAQAPLAPGLTQPEAPTIDLSALNLNEIGLLSNALLGELVSVSAQQFEVQASILEANAATQQSINLIAVSQLPVINSLASIDTTLASIPNMLDAIRIETQRVADAPLVDQLLASGVAFPQTPQERTDFPDNVLSQGGINLFSAFDNLNRLSDSEQVDANLANMENIDGQMQPVNLAEMPGRSEGNPMYAHIVNQSEVQDVRLVGGQIDSVGEIKGQVNVKQVGTVEVTQAGEFVMRLASGDVIPVYVQGGQIQANLVPGEIDTLARQIDASNVVQSQLGFVSGG